MEVDRIAHAEAVDRNPGGFGSSAKECAASCRLERKYRRQKGQCRKSRVRPERTRLKNLDREPASPSAAAAASPQGRHLRRWRKAFIPLSEVKDWHPCAMTAARATCHADDHPYSDECKQHERDIRQVQIHGYETSMPYYRRTGKEKLPGHHPCWMIFFTRPSHSTTQPFDGIAH